MVMELLDLLERRVAGLLQELQALRAENMQLSASTGLITQMREENRLLSEELQKERALRDEIDRRIETLLAGIGADEGETAGPHGA